MHIRKLALGMGIALGLAACTRTPMSLSGDAAVDGKPEADVPSAPDLVPIRADAGLSGLDTAVLGPDTAVLGPDTGVDLRDSAVPIADTAIDRRDTAGLIIPDTAVVFRDSAVGLPDAAPDLSSVGPDTTVPPPDSRETASDPFTNHTFRIDPAQPAPTPDPACTQYQSVDYAQLTFGSDSSTLDGIVVRGSSAMKFHATFGPESDKLTYHIEDLLGGGRVFLQHDQGVYVGQVVIYGSGVPVVWCLRGALTPQP